MQFDEKLKRLCGEKGWNKKTLAERAGVSAQTVGRWWDGTRRPDMADCLALARLFGVTMEWLADDTLDFDAPNREALGEVQQVILNLAARLGDPADAVERLTQNLTAYGTVYRDEQDRECIVTAKGEKLFIPKAAAPAPPRRYEAWGDVGAD